MSNIAIEVFQSLQAGIDKSISEEYNRNSSRVILLKNGMREGHERKLWGGEAV